MDIARSFSFSGADFFTNENDTYFDIFNSSEDYLSFDFGVSPCTLEIHDNWINTALAAVYSLVCFLAVTGNMVVMVVLLYNRHKLSSTDIYLLHLAVADLLFAVTLPFWAVDAVSGWVFGDAMCKIISLLQEVNFYSGILLLACISVDRYLSIIYSTQTCWKKQCLTKLACVAVWVLAILLSLPILYKGTYTPAGLSTTICFEIFSAESDEPWRVFTRFWWKLIMFLVPLAVMIFCYSVMLWKLCQTRGFQKQKAMKVIIAVVLAFLFCWLPHNITVFIDTLMRRKFIRETCDRRHHIDRALTATQTLGFLHSCINPILYAFIWAKFRKNVINLLAAIGIAELREESKFGISVYPCPESGLTSIPQQGGK
ncbi:C-X-C chemokine receptor type 2-like [Scyliorhinus canicula]|uniref:C-X-C chemokine receptor type 2-like n=1 Tax=Scyliorhinus canicula TaxID=7830 RepID=UPI0018F2FF9A|nr:C-X-C chemokine receptor type 2-like [Scyliorhinus canicula]XP_038646130.1 C-X-C chemokine receptor type 2-like [Scyliorhinus canicula]XP_038646131.1 C-X-C chemokine receptor type 2-like [Scyliorhinus canicula]XP_038646132.1 C-X-C chemokine receptor type 2-like [Scyliorhinus canicula]